MVSVVSRNLGAAKLWWMDVLDGSFGWILDEIGLISRRHVRLFDDLGWKSWCHPLKMGIYREHIIIKYDEHH